MANYEYSNDDGLTFDDAFDFEASANEYMGWRADQAQTDNGELIGAYNPGTDSMQNDLVMLSDGTTFGAEDTGSRWINEALQSPTTSTPTLKEDIASGNYPQSKVGQTPPGKGDETATNLINSITKALGPQGIAALITAGSGILAGGSQGKMLEKKWEMDKQRRDEEWARKDAHAAPGKLRKMTWGKGILGEAAK